MAGGGRAGTEKGAAAGRGQTAIQSTIQSIKEVVGGHSDADIYAALRECNMDPNETTQKLLNQGHPPYPRPPPDLGVLRSREADLGFWSCDFSLHWVDVTARVFAWLAELGLGG
jgi:hypothetical protein